jgi:hypothetical protein
MSIQQRSVARTRVQRALAVAAGFAALALAGCAEMPVGPSVAVMPAPNKPFEVFMQEDQLCRGWAAHSVGIPGHDAAAESLLKSTVAGAAIGAIAGAAVGGGRGAGTGAAFGTAVGATAGAGASAATASGAQRRYDIAYQQCMYSKGNVVPSYPTPSYDPPPPPAPR